MIASWRANAYRATGPLKESIGHRWIALTKGQQRVLLYFSWGEIKHTIDQTLDMSVICDAMALYYIAMMFGSVGVNSQLRE